MRTRPPLLHLVITALLALSTTAFAQKKASSPPPQLIITSATVDQETLFVTGVNFDSNAAVTVAGLPMGGVVVVSGTQLQVPFPAFNPGTYLLTVHTGPATVQFDAFSLAVGAIGEKGEKGDKGDTGATGPVGPQGETGAAGPSGASGQQGIQGPPGPQGLQGPAGAAGNLGLSNLSCPTSQFLTGFNAQGGLVCGSVLHRNFLMVCGSSTYPVSNFIPNGATLSVVNGCDPTADTQALLVTRDGGYLGKNFVFQEYLQAGGIIITGWSTATPVYNSIFGAGFAAPNPPVGSCGGNVNPALQLNAADPFWVANAPFVATPSSDTGCGFNIAQLLGITALGSNVANTVSLGYRNRGAGRLWLVEADWQDGLNVSADSRKLMQYMVSHKR